MREKSQTPSVTSSSSTESEALTDERTLHFTDVLTQRSLHMPWVELKRDTAEEAMREWLFEESFVAYNTDEANKSGINSCIHQSKLTNGLLVQLVETYYAQNPDSWALPPERVLRTGLFAMCKTYINNFRSAKGLNLLK